MRHSLAAREQISLHQDRIPQLTADFVSAGAPVSPCESIAGRRAGGLDDRPRREIAGHHRVVDAFGGEGIDEPAGIARQQHAAAAGTAQRPADRDQERREVAPHRFPSHHAPFAQLRDQLALQLVRRLLDGAAVVRQQEPDPDVDVIALREDVGISFRRARRPGALPLTVGSRRFVTSAGRSRRPPTSSTDRRRAEWRAASLPSCRARPHAAPSRD